MTNYNNELGEVIWFPTERDTRKVSVIEKDYKVVVTFPAENHGEYFEVTGKASFVSEREVLAKWQWWWLYWHPAQKERFWFPRERDERRVIRNIKPTEAKLVKRS